MSDHRPDDQPDDRLPGSPESRRFFGDVLTFGWVLPGAIAAGAGLGYLGDRLFGIFPILTAALGFLGLVAGLRQIYRESVALSDEGRGTRK
ncbi:MAG: AtpZ/AtpI family protein [Thermoanaerobaculia bacterium]|nr:AtpZ/AtpI family protein [Thermoanaerobaculia bacterium]